MSQVSEVLRFAHSLAGHPLGVVVAIALVAALVEQRMARRRTPDFSVAYRDLRGGALKPKHQRPPPAP
ncbi:hypothetical protein [Phenylobacterium sp.]|jgi:hypothetical protein|uniref:hypothetical protein n=1 Tax=Phenylobacterium sp. TaxID=1871053 RepID=UPI002E335B49|nr:hypothetical protein [Phenylobacterium sp.]HEX3366442.1 hypothetical protein [Phenylobacterium sp.]